MREDKIRTSSKLLLAFSTLSLILSITTLILRNKK